MSLDHVRETSEPTDEVVGVKEATAKRAQSLVFEASKLLVKKIEAGGDEAEKLKTLVQTAQKSIQALTHASYHIAQQTGPNENYTMACYRLLEGWERDGFTDPARAAAVLALSTFEQLEGELRIQRANQQLTKARNLAERMIIQQGLEAGTIPLTESDTLELYLQLLQKTIQN